MSATLPCPIASSCEVCGSTTDLDVYEADTQLGVLCATVCDDCADDGQLPSLAIATAMRCVYDHCDHTGKPLFDDEDGGEHL